MRARNPLEPGLTSEASLAALMMDQWMRACKTSAATGGMAMHGSLHFTRFTGSVIARQIGACLFLSLLTLGTSIRAEPKPIEDKAIRLNEALAKTIERNPELAAFEYRLEAQEGRALQASLAPNPELGLTVEDALGTDRFHGTDSAQTTLSLGWVLERKVRQRRVGAARASASLLAVDAQILRLDVAAQTARSFLTCLANQARILSADEAVRLADETIHAVQQRVSAGRAPEAELARAQAELATIKLNREDIAHELSSAYRRLAAQWGETEPGFSRVEGDPLMLPTTESFATLTARIGQNPLLARFVSKQRLAEAELRLAAARRWPALRPSVGVRRFESTEDVTFVATIAIPFPVLNRNQGRIAEARATLAQTRADAEAARIRVHTSLFVIYQELKHNLHRAATLRNDVIPRLAKALRETRSGYERGRYSYFEWRSVQADLLEARSALVEASVAAHRHVIELEHLTGVRFAQP